MSPSDALDHIMTASVPTARDWDDFDASIRETVVATVREIHKKGRPSQGFAECLLLAYGKLCAAGEHETAGAVKHHLLDLMAGTPVTLSADLGRVLRESEPVELADFLAPSAHAATEDDDVEAAAHMALDDALAGDPGPMPIGIADRFTPRYTLVRNGGHENCPG